MAQQVVIDIIAETQKLTSGINDANKQLGSIDDKLKGAAGAAVAFASAFVLDKGIQFLKDANAEAKDAELTARNAAIAFGEGSEALEKITEDANKFAEALAIDNDEIIKLSTELAQFLPPAAKESAAEIVNLGFDIAALTGVDVETFLSKFAKGMADGELKVKDLQKLIPGLEDSVYKQAEAMFVAGDAQDALNLLIDEGQKVYGDAAEANVTASDRFEKKLGDLKEQIGTKLLPVIEKLIDFATKILDVFLATPAPVQNIILALIGLVGIMGPLGGIINGTKAAMSLFTGVTIAQTAATAGATIATNLLRLAMIALPIVAIIALIVLLVSNWDTVIKVVGDVGKAIFNWGKDALKAIGDFVSTAAKNLGNFLKDVGEFAAKILQFFLDIPKNMIQIGKNIVEGLWNGISGAAVWLRDKILSFFGSLVPGWVKDVLGIKSPSTVFERIGRNIAEGVSVGLSVPRIPVADRVATRAPSRAPVNVVINAGVGTDPIQLGRVVSDALRKYGAVSTKVIR